MSTNIASTVGLEEKRNKRASSLCFCRTAAPPRGTTTQTVVIRNQLNHHIMKRCRALLSTYSTSHVRAPHPQTSNAVSQTSVFLYRSRKLQKSFVSSSCLPTQTDLCLIAITHYSTFCSHWQCCILWLIFWNNYVLWHLIKF